MELPEERLSDPTPSYREGLRVRVVKAEYRRGKIGSIDPDFLGHEGTILRKAKEWGPELWRIMLDDFRLGNFYEDELEVLP
jgi:hypothetical protein